MNHSLKVREGERTPPRTVKLEAHAPLQEPSIQGGYGSIRESHSRSGSMEKGRPLLHGINSNSADEVRRIRRKVDLGTNMSIERNPSSAIY
jgi:hypothetical protein